MYPMTFQGGLHDAIDERVVHHATGLPSRPSPVGIAVRVAMDERWRASHLQQVEVGKSEDLFGRLGAYNRIAVPVPTVIVHDLE